jgi:hypothetical protein
VTDDGKNVDNMTQILALLFPHHHQVCSLARNETHADDICLHDIAHYRRVVVVEDEAFAHDVGVIDEQINSVVVVADVAENGLDVAFLFDVALEGEQLALVLTLLELLAQVLMMMVMMIFLGLS